MIGGQHRTLNSPGFITMKYCTKVIDILYISTTKYLENLFPRGLISKLIIVWFYFHLLIRKPIVLAINDI